MLTKEAVEQKFSQHPELQQRISVLGVASEINPNFKNPHITGGFLRDIVLGVEPGDCDVFFEGYERNQPGITECVYKAEEKLGCLHFPDWEFENTLATGATSDLYKNTIGFYSNHTDYLTLMIYDSQGNLKIGSPKTLQDLETRTYDIRYQGFLIWISVRGRTYHRAISGVAARGLYLCHKLDLNPSPLAEDLFKRFETHYAKLNDQERESLISYWQKKAEHLAGISSILDKYGITSLSGNKD